MAVSLTASLHEAIKDGNDDAVKTFLKNGANVNGIYSRETALTLAIESHHVNIATRIINHATFSVNTCNAYNRSSLFCAAKESFPELVEALLEMGADLGSRDRMGVSPLGSTAFYNSYVSAAILIQHGASVNEQDKKGRSSLYLACSNVSLEVVELLLTHGADVNIASNYPEGHTPLMAALPSLYERDVRHKRTTDMIRIMKLLIDKECDIDAVDSQGRTALHHAVDANEIHAACILLESGINPEVADNEGMTAFHVALRPDRPRYELALYLLLYGCNANSLMSMSKGFQTNLLPFSVLLQSDPKRLSDIKLKKQLLFIILQCTYLNIQNLAELLQFFNPPNLAVNDEQDILYSTLLDLPSSLHHLCGLQIRKSLCKNYLSKVKTLPIASRLKQILIFGYNFNNFDPLKGSALHTSIQDGDHKNLCSLLKEGVDINMAVDNISPLCLAAKLGSIRIVKILLTHKADPTRLDYNEQTALHMAAIHGRSEIINLFIKTGCDVNIKNGDRNSPLLEAAIHGHFCVCFQLDANGENLCEQGSSGFSPLHLASASGDVSAVRRMIAAGINVNVTDFMGNTSLHVASSRGVLYLKNNIRLPSMYKEEVLEFMDKIEMQMSGMLPKYIREDVNHVDLIKVLLSAGCERQTLNNDAKTAEDIAREFGFMKLFQ